MTISFYERAGFISGVALNVIENIYTRQWSRLLLVTDSANWVLDEEARSLIKIGKHLGVPARIGCHVKRKNSCIHYTSQFILQNPEVYLSEKSCRYSLSYFHGGPDQAEFAKLFGQLTRCKDRIRKLHVSNSCIEKECLKAGFSGSQLAKIPIGVNIDWFDVQTEFSKRLSREKLGINKDAFIVGSFQKDGVGWGEGLEPKLIKGPDIFVDTLNQVKDSIPNLFVVLSGPSRGYVKKELSKANIPFVHVHLKSARDVANLYSALDAYLVGSRLEGGPKAILESMASGVPIITTKVGQATDLIRHGENGWMVDSEDVAGLADGILRVRNDASFIERIVPEARMTAEAEDYMAQTPRWRDLFFEGYIDRI